MPRRLRRRGAGVLALALMVAGCTSAVRVEPPAPGPPADAACRALAKELPARLSGQDRVETDPPSPYVAVWGSSPAIMLRCGVPRPAAMRPSDQVAVVEGVSWFEDPARPALFTAIGLQAHVELTIPPAYSSGGVLTDLSPLIKRTVPR
ncbi:DUF3515 domain-containing protein [Bailinhaonella thermotolerans]|uniref:DUF3515 domain-containing protein n=1 Tax=Bailinhaonella thermotolerans TaxID=1070861 RepID=A0A3A4AAE8_9ACTN|nr:DUF3515 domain-containing protein [Bailinhaonella thermotolerans]RJL25049.1 DUF3515 domain-containing protein [Bailinhaonella thermotolerans]